MRSVEQLSEEPDFDIAFLSLAASVVELMFSQNDLKFYLFALLISLLYAVSAAVYIGQFPSCLALLKSLRISVLRIDSFRDHQGSSPSFIFFFSGQLDSNAPIIALLVSFRNISSSLLVFAFLLIPSCLGFPIILICIPPSFFF